MPVTNGNDHRAQARGLSAKTQDLWLAAQRFRRLADDLAAADTRRPTR
ncbi:MAG: hypothetical protein ACJ8EH_00025 [Sphingomicrobium sp.]